MGNEKIRSFKDLDAWKEGHKLVIEVYRVTKSFPKEEIFGLVNQIRRAVVSITSNIAEGLSRQTKKEKIQFFCTAMGSLTEVQNQLTIARDVGYLGEKDYFEIDSQAVHTQKILNGLLRYLRNT